MTKRLEITLDDETWDRLNAARGHEPRASYVKRALELMLDRNPYSLEEAWRASRVKDPVVDTPTGPKPLSKVPGWNRATKL